MTMETQKMLESEGQPKIHGAERPLNLPNRPERVLPLLQGRHFHSDGHHRLGGPKLGE